VPVEASSEPVTKGKRVLKKSAAKEISEDVTSSIADINTSVSPVLDIEENNASEIVEPEKKKKKLRHFRVLTDEIDPETGKIIARGRYSGTKPKQAANKAYTAINKEATKRNNNIVPLDIKTEFRIIESTRAIKEPKIEQLDENGQVIPSVRNAKGLQGKKKNKNKNKKTKSIYSYTGRRIILPKEQEVPLRDLKILLGFIDVVKNVKNKKTGEITQVTMRKKQHPPLYEEVEVMENGVLIKKMEQKKVTYRYKNDVKKKKVEKNAINADNILEIEDDVKVGKKPKGTKGKGGKSNKEVSAGTSTASSDNIAVSVPSSSPSNATSKKIKGKQNSTTTNTTSSPSDTNESSKPRKSKKTQNVSQSDSVNSSPNTSSSPSTTSSPEAESEPSKKAANRKSLPKSDLPKSDVVQTKGKSKESAKNKKSKTTETVTVSV